MGQSTLKTYSLFADDFPVSSGTLVYRRSNVIGHLQHGVILLLRPAQNPFVFPFINICLSQRGLNKKALICTRKQNHEEL